jgi:hypothetical protein
LALGMSSAHMRQEISELMRSAGWDEEVTEAMADLVMLSVEAGS